MTDSRAALEERAREERCKFERVREIVTWCYSDISEFAADFAEQESSSLKLLLSAMCRANSPIRCTLRADGKTEIRIPNKYSFPVELDSSGIPVFTPEIIEALKNAAIS